jgi:hypothetical protein
MRQILLDHLKFRLEIEVIKSRLEDQDRNMEIVVKYLDQIAVDSVPLNAYGSDSSQTTWSCDKSCKSLRDV